MAGSARARVTSASEASGCLVAPPVFKTGEPRTARLAGSIPVRLRSSRRLNGWAGREPSGSPMTVAGPCASRQAPNAGRTTMSIEYLVGPCTGKRRGVTVTGGIRFGFGGDHARVPHGQHWIASQVRLIVVITLRSAWVLAASLHRR